MKRCTLTVIIAIVVLSTWACSPLGLGTGGEPDAAATQPPAEPNGEEPGLAPGPTQQDRPGEEPGAMPTQPLAESNGEPPEFTFGQIPAGYPKKEIPIYKPASAGRFERGGP